MPLSDVIELTGDFLGGGLFLYLFLTVSRRPGRGRTERLMMALFASVSLWFWGNFLDASLHSVGWEGGSAAAASQIAAFVGLALTPPLLLHTHWSYFLRRQAPTPSESRFMRPLLALLYATPLLLPWALFRLLSAPGDDPLSRLAPVAPAFLLLSTFSYYGSAYLQNRRRTSTQDAIERSLFGRLLPVFLAVPLLNLLAYAWGGPGWDGGFDPTVLAKMSSLAPGSILAYYIVRHRFLDIRISRHFAAASLVLAVLAAYLLGIRRLEGFLRRTLDLPALLLEAVFLALLLLLFPRISRWLDRVVSTLSRDRLRGYRRLAEDLRRLPVAPNLLDSMTTRIQEGLQDLLPGVRVRIRPDDEDSSGPDAFPLRRGGRSWGLLEVRSAPGAPLGAADREALLMLADEAAGVLEAAALLESQVQMERKLSRRSDMEDLGRMAATVAHNVKNPLSSMKTLMQLWKESDNLSEEQRREVQMMIAEVDRLSETVTSLLSFSRLEAEQSVSRRREELELREFFESVHDLFRGDLESRGLRLVIQVTPPQARVHSRPAALREVMSNLVSNAIDACRQGDRIRLEGRLDGQVWEIRVSDTGKGIPSSIRAQLFEPFVSDKTKGTGLGLASVKRRVEQLGGRVDLMQPAQGGTCFRLTFGTDSDSDS